MYKAFEVAVENKVDLLPPSNSFRVSLAPSYIIYVLYFIINLFIFVTSIPPKVSVFKQKVIIYRPFIELFMLLILFFHVFVWLVLSVKITDANKYYFQVCEWVFQITSICTVLTINIYTLPPRQ